MIVQFPGADPADRRMGDRVQALREARGLSLEALAAELRITREELERAERGRAHLSSSQLYAATLALHVPMRLLFEPTDVSGLRRL